MRNKSSSARNRIGVRSEVSPSSVFAAKQRRPADRVEHARARVVRCLPLPAVEETRTALREVDRVVRTAADQKERGRVVNVPVLRHVDQEVNSPSAFFRIHSWNTGTMGSMSTSAGDSMKSFT